MDTQTDGHTPTNKPRTNATATLMHPAGPPHQHSILPVARGPWPPSLGGEMGSAQGGGEEGWDGGAALPAPQFRAWGDPAPHFPTGNGLMGGESYRARSPRLGADSRITPSPALPPPHLSRCQASPPEHEELGAACCAPHMMLHCLASPLQPEWAVWEPPGSGTPGSFCRDRENETLC